MRKKQQKIPEEFEKNNREQLRNEVSIEDFIPYDYHYNPTTIKLSNDRLARVFEVKGVPSQTATNAKINSWHHQWHNFIRTNSDTDLSFYTHVIKEKSNKVKYSRLKSSFNIKFDESYKDKLNAENTFQISFFITIVVKTNMYKLPLFKLNKEQREIYLENANNKLDQVGSYLKNLEHEPRELGIFEYNGNQFSEPAEFLSRLISGEWQLMPVTNSPLKKQIGTSRITAAKETLGIMTSTDSIYCAALGIKDYMPATSPIMFDELIELPFPFILSQSFFPIDSQKTLASIKKQQRMLISSGDDAVSQVEAINTAKDEVGNRDIIFGDYNFSLFVFTDKIVNPLPHETRTQAINNQIKDRIASAKEILGSCSTITAREDLALIPQYFAMLPGNASYRARVSEITSANFTCLFPMHSIANGRWDNNHWGDSVLPLKTNFNTIYDFSYHAQGTDLGHTLIIGTSGSGKTVFQMAILSQAEKFDAKVIHFDYMRGAEIFFRAVGGQYAVLEKGVSTGFNPFQLEPTANNLDFIAKLTLRLAYADQEPPANIVNMVSETISTVFGDKNKPAALRNFSELYHHFQDDDLKTRLKRWTDGNSLGWVFDNQNDTFSFDADYVAIDTTELLDDKELSVPVFMYLTHRIEESFGRRFIASFDEIWKMIGDPVFMPWIKKALKTFRRANGLFLGATQEANDVLSSPLATTLVGQCPTKIFLANDEADKEAYRAFKINDIEYNFIITTPRKGRRMLLKQGIDSIVLQLDAANLNEELAVLSTRDSNIPIMYQCIEEAGNNPEQWLPLFYERFSHE